MANYKNYKISKKQGKFYLKENVPTEGYQEVTYGEGKKTYHQYHNIIKGTPKYFSVKEVTHQGRSLKFLELALEENGDYNQISASLKNNGGYTDEVKALVSALVGYEVGQSVSMSLQTKKFTKKNGKEGESLNVYINYDNIKNDDGKNASTGYIHYNDLPSPTSREVAGETVWDFSPQTEFYYGKINELIAKFEAGANTTTITATPQVQEAFVPTVVTVSEDVDDDLPF